MKRIAGSCRVGDGGGNIDTSILYSSSRGSARFVPLAVTLSSAFVEEEVPWRSLINHADAEAELRSSSTPLIVAQNVLRSLRNPKFLIPCTLTKVP